MKLSELLKVVGDIQDVIVCVGELSVSGTRDSMDAFLSSESMELTVADVTADDGVLNILVN